MTKADVAREYREKHPDMPTLALARLMYKKKSNKLLFENVENARNILRYIEGKFGNAKRCKTIVSSKFFKEEDRPKNPYNLPKSDETEYLPVVIKGHERIAILNDIHAPYHNIEAITAALDFCKKEKVDAVILTEMFDFHGGSRFQKDPRKRKMWEELEIGCEIFKIIHKELKCKIYYKLGNHCERWMHYLWQKLGELDQLEDLEEIKSLNFHTVLKKRLPNVDIEIIDDKRIVKLNQLNVIHGHEFGGSIFSPVNIARGFYLRAKANTIGGHHHRSSEHSEQNINGEITTTWSTGCLCELHPAYLPINSWNLGFAIVYLNGNKSFHVKNLRIFKGKIL
jgi:hypothetical protein